jgi:DNA-binding transcriptional LysR family regulator
MNFRTLDLNLLRVFDVVMSERNVTRAADRLAMSQPAASNALRRLREATGDELFVPSSTGVAPTQHALALWPSVRTALAGLQAALETRPFDPRHDEHTFAVALADATAAVIAPTLLRLLDAAQARVAVRFVPLATRDPRELLERGDADIALGYFPGLAAMQAAEGEVATTLIEPLWSCEYVVVMRQGHPLAAQPALTLDDYLSAGHVRVSFSGRTRDMVDDALADIALERKVLITVNQFHSAAGIVHRSDLLTVLPLSFVPATGFADELAWKPLPLSLPGIDVTQVWHRRHDDDPAQRWLRAMLRSIVPLTAKTVADPAPDPAPFAAPLRRRPAQRARAPATQPC